MAVVTCLLKSLILLSSSFAEVPKGLEPLQGTWVIASAEIDIKGAPAPARMPIPSMAPTGLSIIIDGATAKVYSAFAYSEDAIVSEHYRSRGFLSTEIIPGYFISTKHVTSPLEFTLEAKIGNQIPELFAVIDWPADIPRDNVVPGKGPVRCAVVHTLEGENATLSVSVPILLKSPPARGVRTAWTFSFKKLGVAVAKEYSALTGLWKYRGNPDADTGADQKPPMFLIAPGWCAVTDRGRVDSLLSISLNTEASPRALNISNTDGNGTKALTEGIYALKGDTITVQFPATGKKRPVQFDPANDEFVHFDLERFKVPRDGEAVLGAWMLLEQRTGSEKRGDIRGGNGEKWTITGEEISIDRGGNVNFKTYKYKLDDKQKSLDLSLPAAPDKVNQACSYTLQDDTLWVFIYPSKRPPLGKNKPSGTKLLKFQRSP